MTESEQKNDGKKEKEQVKIKKILVPIDGSNFSMRAARYAIEAAKLQKAQIVIIHVIPKLFYYGGYADSAVGHYFDNMTNQAQLWFNKIFIMAENEGIEDVKKDIFTDTISITDAIISYAFDNSIDLIVIGTKGRTGLEKFLLGSVANGVVQHAHCSVLLVK